MGRAKRTKKHKTKGGEEEETTKITREKQKRKEDEVSDFSHSDSTTNLNTQSESWECPLSAKKQITPDSMNVSSAQRRASLRSSKRLIETGITALSRCSQPRKSRQHSSPTPAIQQLDHLACQVPEGSDLVESPSPSRYHKQVAHPLTTMTMEHEETEKVGDDIPLPVPEMMEEVGEKEPLAKPIPNSMVGVGVGVGVGCPSPSFSLKLTELVSMVDDDDDDEVDSITQTVEGYEVKPEFTGILRKLLIRHGDIAKNCTASTMELRSALLEMICGIISELQGKDLRQIKEDFLRRNIALVNGIKNMQVEIEWLRLLLVEMLEAKEILEQCGKFKEVKENNRKTVEDAESKLAECRERKKELSAMFEELSMMMKSTCDEERVCKETLALAKDESTKMTRTIKEAASKVKRFLNCSPVDHLLL